MPLPRVVVVAALSLAAMAVHSEAFVLRPALLPAMATRGIESSAALCRCACDSYPCTTEGKVSWNARAMAFPQCSCDCLSRPHNMGTTCHAVWFLATCASPARAYMSSV